MRGVVAEAQSQPALHLAAGDRAGHLIEIDGRRLHRRAAAACPCPAASIAPTASLPSKRSSRFSGPVVLMFSRAGPLPSPPRAPRAGRARSAASSLRAIVGLEPAVETRIGRGERAEIGDRRNAPACRSRRRRHRAAPRRSGRPRASLAAALPPAACSRLTVARSFAVLSRAAMRRSGSASIGANFSASAMTALSSRASRSTAMLPPGVAVVSMRPLASIVALPKSATDRRSIWMPPASNFTRAALLRASKPAIRARPTSSASAISRGALHPDPGERAVGETEQGIEIDLARLADRHRAAPGVRRRATDRPAGLRRRRDRTRSATARSAMRSAPSVTSPRNCHGLICICPAATGWPASQAISALGSLASTLAAPAKPSPLAVGSSRPLALTLVKPGARKSSLSSRHAAPSDRRSLPNACSTAPPSVTASMLTVRLTGIARAHHAAEQFGERLRRRDRQTPRRIGGGDQPVEIDLPRRQRALQPRPLAELDFRRAVELGGALLRPVLELDLLQQRGLRVRP